MINARKSISSLWKAKNARQSVNPWRRRRRKEKSWRNIARERRYLFSRRRKETESQDKKIYKMLESPDFNFGGKTYKAGEAGLMFVYEIGVECGRIYVIALTEKFGTIIFYIPEESAERIKERVQQIPYSLNDYLSFLIEFKDFEVTLKPFRISGLSINDAAAALGRLNSFGAAAHDAAGSLAEFAAAYEEKAQEPAPVPNNWLKIHGFPMRRKGRGKRKSEQMDRKRKSNRRTGYQI